MAIQGQHYHQNMVHFLRKKITYADDGTTVSVGLLPPGASVVGGGVVVRTVFNGDATNTVDIGFRNAVDGTTDDTDDYATDLSLATEGVIVADTMATATGHTDEGAEVVAVVTSTASASAGVGYVWVEYIVDNDDTD